MLLMFSCMTGGNAVMTTLANITRYTRGTTGTTLSLACTGCTVDTTGATFVTLTRVAMTCESTLRRTVGVLTIYRG